MRHDVTTEDVLRVLERTASVVNDRIFRAFRVCVSQLRYERRKTQGTNFSMTAPQYEIPFWILRQRGETFAVEKVAEVISCYYGLSTDNDRYEELLEELRQEDRELWQRCILQVLEQGIISLHIPIKYLIEVQEPVYLSRCRERLEQGAFNRLDVGSLLEYLSATRPPWYREVLEQCYSGLKKRLRRKARRGNRGELEQDQAGTSRVPSELTYGDQFRPLLMLMSDDDDQAWKEFARRLRREDVPLREAWFSGTDVPRFPVNSTRLPVPADWYALLCRTTGEGSLGESDLTRRVLESIVAIGGESAIQELRRRLGLSDDPLQPCERLVRVRPDPPVRYHDGMANHHPTTALRNRVRMA